jgi:hypothetical protein
MIKNITNILNYETTSKYNIDVMASNNITTFNSTAPEALLVSESTFNVISEYV